MLPASPHAHLAVHACTRGMAATAAGKNYITSGFMTSSTIFFLKKIGVLHPPCIDCMLPSGFCPSPHPHAALAAQLDFNEAHDDEACTAAVALQHTDVRHCWAQ